MSSATIYNIKFKKMHKVSVPFRELPKADQKDIIKTRENIARIAEKDPMVMEGMGGKKALGKYKAYTSRLRKIS